MKTTNLKEKIKKFDIVGNFKYFIIAPAVLLLAGIILLCVLGFNKGIDFTGGSVLKITAGTDIESSEKYNEYTKKIEEVLKQNNINSYYFQKEGTSSKTAISVRFQDPKKISEEEYNTLASNLETGIKEKLDFTTNTSYKFEATQRIGATASGELLLKAFIAVLVAVILILIYIAVRFEFSSGISAICGLLHDVLMMCSLVLIFRIQVNSSFIAALITIIGYSINNTIIIFDKVRELVKPVKNTDYNASEIVNTAVKTTFVRTLNTSITTLFAVVMLAVIGVTSIKEFIIPIIFGLICGTYSSVLLCPTLWVYFQKLKTKIKNNKKLNKKPVKNA